MFYNELIVMGINIKAAVLAAVFLLAGAHLFSQEEAPQWGSIPEELLRPRKGEAPRYPIDTVIGELGQGKAPKEAYDCAKRAADAFLSGTMTASVFSSVDKVFLEGSMGALNSINPRYYRLGSGREEPDGSVSFLVRFAGREEGITGELFIRQEKRRIEPTAAQIQAAKEKAAQEKAAQEEAARNEATPGSAKQDSAAQDAEGSDNPEGGDGAVQQGSEEAAEVEIELPVQYETRWVFEDIILEEPRTREAENTESRQKFDFPPYERFF
jgi:hypothetical protein